MRRFLLLFPLFILLLNFSPLGAQTRSKGYNYKAHHKTNIKAQRWAKHRLKAANYDQTNVRCSVKTSRKATKKRG